MSCAYVPIHNLHKTGNMKRIVILGVILFWQWGVAVACTDFLFPKGAARDGSTMITCAADSHTGYGLLRYCPAADHKPGEMLRIYDCGSLKYLLSIPQPEHTCNVAGFISGFQLAIGETTRGGIPELEQGNSTGIDYGNLIYAALQRARNCREATVIMDELTRTCGYASGGESFSLCDPNEVWICEITDKGKEQGAVWVARRVPQGYVCGHASQARITQFPPVSRQASKPAFGKGHHKSLSSHNLKFINDPEVECVCSEDVISLARNNGWYQGSDGQFSFADTCNPITFSRARACDARVYAMYNRVNPDMKRYEAYAMGDIHAERPPLWIQPDHRIDVHEVMNLMRNHFEGTPMDMTQDAGAGPYRLPYRWRPMDWEADGKKYVDERATSTRQTGFSFVAQCRGWLPDALGGIIRFGVDDTYSTCYCPMCCSMTRIPICFEYRNGSMTEYSETAAFWLFNRVTNFCYLRYDSMIKDVQDAQQELETYFIGQEAKHADQWAQTDNASRLTGELNRFSNNMAEKMMRRWKELDNFLLVKYIDGNIKHESNGKFETTETGVVKFPDQPEYPAWFYKQIVEDHGDIILVK